MKLLHSAHYQKEIDNIALPYLKKRCRSGRFERICGQKLYYEYYRADKPETTIVLLHGFSEAIPKFTEMIYYFVQSGFDVWALQQREHGLSYRSSEDLSLVDITDYRDLIRDAHYFVHHVVKKRGSLYLYAHSMGGAVGACYLECYPEDFEKAVLTSPMLEMNSGDIPVWFAAAYARVQCALGHGSDYMPGTGPFVPTSDFEGGNTTDPNRYMFWFNQQKEHREFQMCGCSIRCALQFLHMTQAATLPRNVHRIRADVLLIQAGRDAMVKSGGQIRFIRELRGRGHMVRFRKAKHEIYLGSDRQVRRYVNLVVSFFK